MAEAVKKEVAETTPKIRRESSVKVKIYRAMLEILNRSFH